jgi:hypothetical protein
MMFRPTAPVASALADGARRAAGEVGADEPGEGTRLGDGGGQPAREAWLHAVFAPPASARYRAEAPRRRARGLSPFVGRIMGWIGRNRRLARDVERHGRIAAALVRTAMIRIVLRRRAGTPSA